MRLGPGQQAGGAGGEAQGQREDGDGATESAPGCGEFHGRIPLQRLISLCRQEPIIGGVSLASSRKRYN
ncbi:hypothetical protein GCM10019016_060220 [Streptomyces prasinosporus]|uniref:Transposase n=1 Tax=Streptomyces prasinosporus TaxID=68256 RepID=A0ABP6TWM9_9ACTN